MNELLQQRIESVQADKNITHAQIEAKRSLREQLDSDLEAFLKNGGKVETLPRGYSGLSDELKPTQKMRSISPFLSPLSKQSHLDCYSVL